MANRLIFVTLPHLETSTTKTHPLNMSPFSVKQGNWENTKLVVGFDFVFSYYRCVTWLKCEVYLAGRWKGESLYYRFVTWLNCEVYSAVTATPLLEPAGGGWPPSQYYRVLPAAA